MNDNDEPITYEWLTLQITAYYCDGTEVWFRWCEDHARACVSDGGDTVGLPIRSRGDMRDLVRVLRLQPVKASGQ